VDRLRNVFRGLADAAGGDVEGAAAGKPAAPTDLDQALLDKAATRRSAFDEALADDLNTAAALAEVFSLAREINAASAGGEVSSAGAAAVRSELGGMVHVLGLDAVTGTDDSIPADVVAMAEERRAARAARDFAKSDSLRSAIAERGYEVRDVPDGFKIIPIR
jgi:cysteinyl-tRNA synthetase